MLTKDQKKILWHLKKMGNCQVNSDAYKHHLTRLLKLRSKIMGCEECLTNCINQGENLHGHCGGFTEEKPENRGDLKASLKIATDALISIEVLTADQKNVLPFETINTTALKALRAIRDMEK